MNDETELDPVIVAALRDVPSADQALREAQIAAALDHVEVARTNAGGSPARQRWLSVAAATAALAGGFLVGRAGDDTANQPRNAAVDVTTTTMPPKTGTACATEVGDGRILAEYASNDGPRMIVLGEDALVIIDAESCAPVQTIPLP